MHLRLIRNATLRLELGGRHLLVDPMLDPAGARPPVEGSEDDRRNPLVELPEPAEVVVAGLDAVLITHLHRDHFDAAAAELLPKDLPVFCQPEDREALAAYGFTDLRPVDRSADFDGIAITRVARPARLGRRGRGARSGLGLRPARSRGADDLHRRRHRPLRRASRRRSPPTGPTSWW